MAHALRSHSSRLARRNMERALPFYVDVLGFRNAWRGTDGDQGKGGAWIWVGSEDVRELHEHSHQKANLSWALEIRTATSFASDPMLSKQDLKTGEDL